MVKSGTDFQYLTEVFIELLPAGNGGGTPAAPAAAVAACASPTSPQSPRGRCAEVPPLAGTLLRCPSLPSGGCASPEGRSAADVYASAADASLVTTLETCRAAGGSPYGGAMVHMRCVRHAITSDLPLEAEVEEIVQARERCWLCVPNAALRHNRTHARKHQRPHNYTQSTSLPVRQHPLASMRADRHAAHHPPTRPTAITATTTRRSPDAAPLPRRRARASCSGTPG